MEVLGLQRKILFLLCFIVISGIIAERNKKEVNYDEVKHHQRKISKTIQTEDGDIFDCIDIKSQPAFNHPLLRNHSIKIDIGMHVDAPSSYPTELHDSSMLPDTELESTVSPVSCPSGTIPIWRNEQQHPKVNMREITRKIYARNTTQIHRQITLLAGLSRGGDTYGTRVSISVYEPDVYGVDDRSGALVTIINGYAHDRKQSNTISVGWFVWQGAGGDKTARFHIYFDNDHCFDLQCSGFVQVNRKVAIGGRLKPVSQYNGRQAALHISVFQDNKSDWWVTHGKDGKLVGYWPAELFTFLRARGATGYWGGVVEGPTIRYRPPPMGSGHLASEGFGKAAFVKRIRVLVGDGNLINPPAHEYNEFMDNPKCYTVANKERGEVDGMYANWGGPGDCRI